MARLFERLSSLDRRFVFLFLLAAVTVPFFLPLKMPVAPSKEVRAVFRGIEEAAKARKPVLASFDFDPGSLAELGPMSEAILAHAFALEVPVIAVSFVPTGGGLALDLMGMVGGRTGREYGRDYVFLGFNPAAEQAILGMGIDFREIYSVDFRGTPLAELPLMSGVKNFEDVGLAIDLSASIQPGHWVLYGAGRYHLKLAIGVTAVMATEYYPYIQSGQAIGIVGGMRGAAEYETLLAEKGVWTAGDATRGMGSQSLGHLAIILLMVAGNAGYFLARRRRDGNTA